LEDFLQKEFDKTIAINNYACPGIGEAYAMATEDKMEGFAEKGGIKHWNQHWAGVIMKAGNDAITMESYARGATEGTDENQVSDIIYRDWIFGMYQQPQWVTGESGEPFIYPLNYDQLSKTFHAQHLNSGTHGNKATTMSVISTK